MNHPLLHLSPLEMILNVKFQWYTVNTVNCHTFLDISWRTTQPGILPDCDPEVSWSQGPLFPSTALWTPQTAALPPERQWRSRACCSFRSPAGPGRTQDGPETKRLGSEPTGPRRLQTHGAEPWEFCRWCSLCWSSGSTVGCYWRWRHTVLKRGSQHLKVQVSKKG